jgi:aldehyde:ferredoxin oxidoreductase
MHGYFGRYLRVDLTQRRSETRETDSIVMQRYLGGAGIGARILYDETDASTDPLGPANLLAAFTGPFTGTRVPSTSRHHVMARSPLTGIFGESNVGGSWSVHFKKCGYDGLVVTGKADAPVYLWINDEGAEIRDAGPIWGRDAYESAAWVKERTAAKATVAVIGPAGEKLAPIASIPHIGHVVRAAARTGLGAVMGSKNLKAIAVFGTGEIPLADPARLEAGVKERMEHITSVTETFRKFGTSGGIGTYEKIGNFPLKNWAQGRWDGVDQITGVAMHDTLLSGRKACLNCPIVCGRHVKITEGPHGPLDAAGPEYESIGTLGGECLVSDLAAICKANDLCNRYGLDTISAGATIAFTMEAFEKGLLTRSDTDGIEAVWGNAGALVALVEKMGRREGIGSLMGEGSYKMAKALGRNAVEFAVHVKGLEPSAHDPRRFFSHALNYATAARGACHNASWSHPYELSLAAPEIGIDQPQDAYQVDGKAEFTAKLQNMQTAFDCLIICRFTQIGKAVTLSDVTRWLSAVVGRDVGVPELMEVGERVFNLKRLFNTRAGISRKDDFLPPRLLTRNRTGAELTNQLPPFGRLLSDYYEHRGWSEDGIPTPAALQRLGL